MNTNHTNILRTRVIIQITGLRPDVLKETNQKRWPEGKLAEVELRFIDGAFVTHRLTGLAVREGKKGKYVQMPSRSYMKDRTRKYYDYLHTGNWLTRRAFRHAILKEHKRTIKAHKDGQAPTPEEHELLLQVIITALPSRKTEWPESKRAEAEVRFLSGFMRNHTLRNVTIWASKDGDGFDVTGPARSYSKDGNKRFFDYLSSRDEGGRDNVNVIFTREYRDEIQRQLTFAGDDDEEFDTVDDDDPETLGESIDDDTPF